MAIRIDLSAKQRKSPTSLVFEVPKELPPGRYGFWVRFEADDYPLQQHFCYMRPKSQSRPYDGLRRFAEMEFSPNEPGIAVGPWPRWRFVPPMPEVTLTVNGVTFSGRFNFWGDETAIQKLQALILAELPSSQSLMLELNWSDMRLQPISIAIHNSAKRKAKPIRTVLKDELRNSYPRLLFGSQALDDLRSRITSTHGKIWAEILRLRDNWQLEFTLTPESKTLPGPERLHVFDRVVISAFIAILTQNSQDFRLALQTFFDFLALASSADFEPMQIDTQAGETLFNACTAYDWLWQNFSSEQKAEAERKLFALAARVWDHLGYQRDDYAQAHFLGCSHGLLAFSFLFWEKHARAREWIEYFHGAFKWIVNMLPEDGFYPHGINLWIYEHLFLLRYLELFDHCADVNFWHKSAYWQQASHFRTATLSPDRQLSLTFGDPQYRVGGDAWMHFLIASRCQSAQAQQTGNTLQSIPPQGVDFRSVPPRRRVWEFLYLNPAIRPKATPPKPTFFADGGQIFYREQNDRDQLLITFRADSLLGKQRYKAGEWSGYGHSDPCNGSFLVMKNQAFLISGPGPVYRRDTALHNTLTFDARGQIGDSCTWAPEFVPENRFAKVIHQGEDARKNWLTADLAPCYLDFLGVKKCIRHFALIRPGLLVIRDDIELLEQREIQWNVHTYGEFAEQTNNGHFQCLISHQGERVKLYCLSPASVAYKTGFSEFVPAYPHSGERDSFLQLSVRHHAAQFLVLISLGGEALSWQLLPDDMKKSSQIAKIIYAGEEYIF